MTLAFTPLIPMVAPISIAGFVFDYWVKKVTLLRLVSRPRELNERIARKMLQFVKVAIVLYGVGLLYFCYDLDDSIVRVTVAALITALVFFMIPVSLFRCCFKCLIIKSKYSAQSYDQQSKFFVVSAT